MTALRLVSGPGMTDRAAAEEACVELVVHNAEAIEFAEDCRAYAQVIGKVLLAYAPHHHRLVRDLRRRIDSYEDRHRPDVAA